MRLSGDIVLRSGATRHVVLIGGLAFKIPRVTHWRLFLYGLLGNMQERRWSGASDRLCPVLFALPGGWLVVMPRVAPLTDIEWEVLDALWDSLYGEDAEMLLPVERKRCSVGTLGRRFVAVDYGS